MDIGSPVRVLSHADFLETLPKPENEEQRVQCSFCCAAYISGSVLAATTIALSPFSAFSHGVFPPKPAANTKAFRHPLSSSPAEPATPKFHVSDGGGLYTEMNKTRDAQRGRTAQPSTSAARPSASPLSARGGEHLVNVPSASLGKATALGSRAKTVLRFYGDRYMFHTLPFACITFTHQYIVSQLLWSKGQKSLFRVNFESLFVNTALWLVGAMAMRFGIRRFVIPKSKTARLAQFDWERKQRMRVSAIRPMMVGELSKDFSVRQVVFLLIVYSFFWSVLSLVNEHLLSNHYSPFHKFTPSYSRMCAPRWREWRENEIKKRKVAGRTTEVIQEMGERQDQSMWGAAKTSRPIRVQ